MAIILNHTVVPAHDKEASARFFAGRVCLCSFRTGSHVIPSGTRV